MSRRRKQNSRRPIRSQRTETNSSRTELNPRSCVFVGPEEAVTTFEVKHPATLGRRNGGRAQRDATIIKGCPSRYALENCGTLQMGTLSYYRKHGDSLIWDMKEGVIAGDDRVEDRRDDPTDLHAYSQLDTEMSVSHPLRRAVGTTTVKRLDANETSQTSLLLGDNCFIWCASLEPQNPKEWSLWWSSLEPHYDHKTLLGDPAQFARVIAMMASPRRSLLGSYVDFKNPTTGHVEQCSNLAVFYGPVVYLDDPRDYILEPDDEVELVVRRIFTKTMEHRHQREYRFALLSQHALDVDTVHLQVPRAISHALRSSSGPTVAARRLPEFGPPACVPSARLRRCFASDTAQGVIDYRHGISHSTEMRVTLHLNGTQDKSLRRRQIAVNEVEMVDHETIREVIRTEPRASDDARIAQVTIDGGPGTVTHIYCLEGIWGEIRLVAVPGGASLRFQAPHPEIDSNAPHPDDASKAPMVLCSNTEFDGQFKLAHSAQQLILTVVPMNPAAIVEIVQPCRNPNLPHNHVTLSSVEDTTVTVRATSEDGMQTRSLEIIVDHALCPANDDKSA